MNGLFLADDSYDIYYCDHVQRRKKERKHWVVNYFSYNECNYNDDGGWNCCVQLRKKFAVFFQFNPLCRFATIGMLILYAFVRRRAS